MSTLDQSNYTAPLMIETQHVSKRFGGVVALDDVSIKIRTGELLAICGENGAGKSTLMKILSGQHPDYEGQILLRGNAVRFNGIKDAENAGISIIHQELNLVEELSVSANIFLGREKSSFGMLDSKSMNDDTRQLMQQLQCNIAPQATVRSLRVGDQQLVEIAKAVSISAEILIMDEPTSALTESEVARLDQVISELRGRGVTIVYISHKMDEIFRLSDRITILRDGKSVDTVETASVTPNQVTEMMVGRQLSQNTRRRTDTSPIVASSVATSQVTVRPAETGEPILSVRKLWRAWPGQAKKWRLKDISFDLRRGEIVGVAGLMGAGRTELFECLFGCCDDDFGGELLFEGKPIRPTHSSEAIQHGLSLVTEDRKRSGVFQNLDVRENITIGSLGKLLKAGLISRSSEKSTSQSIVERLNIKLDGLNARIGSLSGGNQQKCLIGRALLTEPRVLLLDDPTRGIDVGAKAELHQLLGELTEQGIAILMSSSELPELLMNCDRILVLCEGRLTGHFTSAEATEQKILQAATTVGSP